MTFIVENEDYPFWVTKKQFGFIVAAMSFGAMLSTIPTGMIRHKYGTKRTILLFAIPSTLGAILITIPQNIAMVSYLTLLIKSFKTFYSAVNARTLFNWHNSWMLFIFNSNLCWRNLIDTQSRNLLKFHPHFCAFGDHFHLHPRPIRESSNTQHYLWINSSFLWNSISTYD
jgi:hypothetical protein